MKIFLLVCNICLLSLLSCTSNDEKKSEHDSTIKNTHTEIQIRLTACDTINFQTFTDLSSFYSHKYDSIEKLRTAMYKSDQNISSDSIQAMDSVYYTFQYERNHCMYKYIANHHDSTETLNGIIYLVVDKKFSIASIDSLFQLFPEKLQATEMGRFLQGKIQERKKTELISTYNKELLTMKFVDANNNMVSLQDVPGNYLLLDFWASWCAPCRYENRILVKEKQTIIGRDDVAVVAVSLDKVKSKWLKAAKEDGLNYLTICDFKVLESPLVKGFSVTTVPYNLLIDKNGKILAVNLWGEKLRSFLQSQSL